MTEPLELKDLDGDNESVDVTVSIDGWVLMDDIRNAFEEALAPYWSDAAIDTLLESLTEDEFGRFFDATIRVGFNENGVQEVYMIGEK